MTVSNFIDRSIERTRQSATSEAMRDVRCIVLHWGSHSALQLANYFRTSDRASAHWAVDETGAYQMLPEYYRAWHATWINNWSIGIDVACQPVVSRKAAYEAAGRKIIEIDNPTNPRRGDRRILTIDPRVSLNLINLLKQLSTEFGIPLRTVRGADGKVRHDRIWSDSSEFLNSGFKGIIGHHHQDNRKWDIAPWWSLIFESMPELGDGPVDFVEPEYRSTIQAARMIDNNFRSAVYAIGHPQNNHDIRENRRTERTPWSSRGRGGGRGARSGRPDVSQAREARDAERELRERARREATQIGENSLLGQYRASLREAIQQRIEEIYRMPTLEQIQGLFEEQVLEEERAEANAVPDDNLDERMSENVSAEEILEAFTEQRSGENRQSERVVLLSPLSLALAVETFLVGLEQIENGAFDSVELLFELTRELRDDDNLESIEQFISNVLSQPKFSGVPLDNRTERDIARGRDPRGWEPPFRGTTGPSEWYDNKQEELYTRLKQVCRRLGNLNSVVTYREFTNVGDSTNGSNVDFVSSLPSPIESRLRALDPWMFDFIRTHANGENPFDQKNLGGAPFWFPSDSSKKWTSLGRLFGFFFGLPMAYPAALDREQGGNKQYEEVQFFWHCFNSNASWYANQPICNFLIEKTELEDVLGELFATGGNKISVNAFISAINDKILRNPASASYGFDKFYDTETDANGRKVAKKKTAFKENNAVFTAERNELLRRSYARFGDSDPAPDFSMPRISLEIKNIPHLFANPTNGNLQISANSLDETVSSSIVRVHFTDAVSSRWTSLASMLQAVRIDDPRTPTAASLNRSTEISEGTQELLNEIKAGLSSDIEFNENTQSFVFRGGFTRLKEIYKRVMPSLIYDGEGTMATSARFSSTSNSQLASLQLSRALRGTDISPAQNNASGLPLRVDPSSVKLEMLGMPFVGYSQNLFIDFQTGTSIDNIYRISGINYEISPGKFTTSCDLTITSDAYSRLEGPLQSLTRALAISSVSGVVDGSSEVVVGDDSVEVDEGGS